jgi:hypothetical protein
MTTQPVRYKVKDGHRRGDSGTLLKTDSVEWEDKTTHPIVMLMFPDGERFGYLAKDVQVG